MKKTSKQSQVAIEFIFFIGMGFILIIIFASVAYKQLDDFETKREAELLEDVLYKVQTEFTIAARVEDGYRRAFIIPEKLDNTLNYSIVIRNNTILGETKHHQYFLIIPAVQGTLLKGNNTISKSEGTLYVN